MPERYKLRLSDGTVLVVDHEGLSTWLVDDAAMVLAPGVEKWRSLRGFISAESRSTRAAAPPVPAIVGAAPVASPPVGEPRGLLVLADDVAGSDLSRPDRSAPSSVGAAAPPSKPDDALPIIPLRPLDDAEARVGTVWDGDAGADSWEGPPSQNVVDERVLRVLIRLGYLLSPWVSRLDGLLSPSLRRLDGQIRLWRSRRPSGEAPRWLDRVRETVRSLVASARRMGTALVGLASRRRAAAPIRFESPSPAPRPAHDAPPPIEPLKAPLPIHEVPVLRLAEIQEPEEPETLYGEAVGRHAGWAWVKGALLVTCLLAATVAVIVDREAWLPKAALGSRVLFGEVDAWARSREQGDRRAQALREAREQIPHLAPATLQLVVSASPAGALDPPALFRLASDVTDRGLEALPPAEAHELVDLREQLIEALPPEDRERAREYDQARAHRATLAFEDRDALALFARGALAMPYASRARLQALSGEAIAAGLQTPPGAPGRP